jgi:hypothetical protein
VSLLCFCLNCCIISRHVVDHDIEILWYEKNPFPNRASVSSFHSLSFFLQYGVGLRCQCTDINDEEKPALYGNQ